MRRVKRHRQWTHDPTTPDEWQEAVDGAEFMLLVESARLYGLIETDMVVDVGRCDELLRRGKDRGHKPAPLDELVAAWIGT